MLAIIGGTGLDELEGLSIHDRRSLETPYGPPSDDVCLGTLNGQELVFLARHGRDHRFAPHAINYRANIAALCQVGVSSVLAVAAVGGIRQDYAPGNIGIPDQIIDYTWGRAHSFSSEGDVRHIEFTQPYDSGLRAQLIDIAEKSGLECVTDGVYGCTQGPRLESAAEIARLRRDGCDVVGMTAMPEAALAREAGLRYAGIAVSINWAAGVGGSGGLSDASHDASESDAGGIHAQIEQHLESGMSKVRQLITALINAQ